MKSLVLICSMVLSLFSTQALAVGSEISIGFNVGLAGGGQSDMNKLISNANTRESGLSVSDLGNAWDLNATFTYRVTDMIGLQFRPGMYMVSEDGSNSSGSFEYAVTGFTIFPVMRLYLLENNYIAFFSNIAVGWGYLSGEIKEASDTVEFSEVI